ncbi:MAG TPA: translation initiation factor IF-3 [Oscillospiraceae bacterium]|nr:translation initiation factor IF-3 [Oscillospiraceae bacterium]HPS35296.1 translation initiation factor IF-3 [Oscillospiraceae bacterium]
MDDFVLSVYFFLSGFGGAYTIATKELQINEAINDRQIRVIGADGAQLGVMSAAAARELAYDKDLDLVKISPNADPPVCKIMDYGKYRFEQTKREKEIKKNQHIIEIKGMSLSLKIDTHDFETKARQVCKFLDGGDRVKVSIRLRGREMTHIDIGIEVMNRFAETCAGSGTVDKPPKLEGRFIYMFLSPKTAK